MTWPTTPPDNPATAAQEGIPSSTASPSASGNGSEDAGGPPVLAASRLPQPRRWTTRTKMFGVLVGLLVVAGTSGGYFMMRGPRNNRTDLVTYKVRSERLELTIVERGALESAKNSDIYCTVKSGARGANSASTIKWVIDDGSSVKKGDLLVELDDSGLQDQLKQQKITVDNAEADKVKAEEDYKIQDLQNESDKNTAAVNKQLAEIDLKKYLKGDYEQALKDVLGRIKVAEGDFEQQRERAAWANRMVKKGYYTVTQSQAEQSKLDSYKLALEKVQEEKRVLDDPEYGMKKRTETDLENKLEQAKLAVKTVESQANAREAQARSIREAKKSVYAQELTKYKEIEEEIKKCKIFAPQDGMVVYYIPDQARFGGGSQQSIVAQGEPVREGQKLMQIPNLRRMLVNTKVHEALVSRVTSGQAARVRIDSFPDRILRGHVDSVATVSSQQDWLSADVKVYTTKVFIDDVVHGLKPGMSAEVTITVGAALENVITIPIQAIVGGVEMGKQRKCFVLTPQGPQERDIVIGESNEKMAEIKQGLYEGEEVVLNPRVLIGDKAKTREPGADRRGSSGESKPGDDGKGAAPAGKDKSPGSHEEKRPSPEKVRGPMGEGPPAGAPVGQFSAEDRQKQMDKFRQASPEQRKKMLDDVPEAFRDKVKEKLKEQGIEVK
jgi:multidrug efflux pump subunit AcrA (membrane-fusion protein)